jgi:hypothetical protein
MSHDQNFKNLILDYPDAALAFFAAGEGDRLPGRPRIIPIRQEQLKERLGDRFRELDVPLLVEWPDGQREALLFVIEHESAMRRFSAHRLAHYCLDLAELFELERVVPVVIFLRAGQYQPRLQLRGEHAVYLDFSFLACELASLPAQHYLDSDNIVARLNLPNMSYAENERVQVYAQAHDGLAALEPNPEKRRKYVDFIEYYLSLNDAEWVQYWDVYLPQSAHREVVMGLLQRSRDEGLQEGIQLGKQEGIEQGWQESLLENIELILEIKFGAAGLELLPEIRQIQSVDTLRAIQKRIKTADNTEAVRDIYRQS